MSEQLYKQCLLHRSGHMMTSWIPLKFAKRKKILKLKCADGEWEDGWEVVTEYGQIINEATRKALSDQWAYARRTTDV